MAKFGAIGLRMGLGYEMIPASLWGRADIPKYGGKPEQYWIVV